MALKILTQERVWLDKARYADAERVFHEKLSKEERKVTDQFTAQYVLADICEPKNLKLQTLKKVKMSKSKSRKTSQSDNFSFSDEITKYHDCSNFNELLSSVEQWDIETPNQYKMINKFVCLVCYFISEQFNEWKIHIMSISHVSHYQKAKDLYSYVCSSKGCKLLLYGPEKLLITHKTRHLESDNITGVPILMAEVMKRFITKQNSIYYCSHCKIFEENPIHSDIEKSNIEIKCPVEYYCKYCKVNFYSSLEMIDYHSLSVEHMTLKCFDMLCLNAQMNSIKANESDQSNKNKKNSLPTVKKEVVDNSIPLPNVHDINSFSNDVDSIEIQVNQNIKMSEEEWVVELRSCLTSVKDGIPLDQIESDLFNVTGTKIPYKNLGYPSLEACLSSSGQFTIRNRGGVSIVYAVASKKTQHLTELIKKQKSKVSKKKSVYMNKRKVRGNFSAQKALVDVCESKNLKKQSLKEINISKSKKRNLSQCEYSSLFDEVTKYHDCNNFNELLCEVEQWDIKTPNQYKHINKFQCLVCYFKTDKFNEWKLHIMSILHLLNCRDMKDLYSYVCSSKGCKNVLYGPHELLNIHKANHLEYFSVNKISLFMVEVMKRFINKQNNILFFCSHCKKFNEESVHSSTRKLKISSPIRFFCSYCKVDFYSSPEMIDYHSLTVEHLTLKCFHKLLHNGKTNFKKMKLSRQSNENEIINNSMPLPNLEQNTPLFRSCDWKNGKMENDSKHVPIVQVKKSLVYEVIGSTPTVIFDKKSQEINPVNNKTTPNEIIDSKLKLNVALTSRETASDNATNLENEDKLDEDKAYGAYVTQRLKNISNSTVKQDIKCEIDYLFYIKIKKLLQKNE